MLQCTNKRFPIRAFVVQTYAGFVCKWSNKGRECLAVSTRARHLHKQRCREMNKRRTQLLRACQTSAGRGARNASWPPRLKWGLGSNRIQASTFSAAKRIMSPTTRGHCKEKCGCTGKCYEIYGHWIVLSSGQCYSIIWTFSSNGTPLSFLRKILNTYRSRQENLQQVLNHSQAYFILTLTTFLFL